MKRQNGKERALFEAILELESLNECHKFFLDLCTPAELQALADRWAVAQLLARKMPYRMIYEKTGVSTATITRVARCMEYGDGYQIVLKRMEERVGTAHD